MSLKNKKSTEIPEPPVDERDIEGPQLSTYANKRVWDALDDDFADVPYSPLKEALFSASRTLQGLKGVSRILQADTLLRWVHEDSADDTYQCLNGCLVEQLQMAQASLLEKAQDGISDALFACVPKEESA